MRQTIITGRSFPELLPCLIRRIEEARRHDPFHSDLIVVPGFPLVRYLEEVIARRIRGTLLNIHILPLRLVPERLCPPEREFPEVLSSAALLAFARYILAKTTAFREISSFDGVERGFQRTVDELVEAGLHDPDSIELYLNEQHSGIGQGDLNMLKVFPAWLKGIRSTTALHPGLALSTLDTPIEFDTLHIYGFLSLKDVHGEALQRSILLDPPDEIVRYHPGVRSLTETPPFGLEYSRELIEQEIGATAHIEHAGDIIRDSPETDSVGNAEYIEAGGVTGLTSLRNRSGSVSVTAAPGIEAEVSLVASEIIGALEEGSLHGLDTTGIILSAKDRMVDVLRRVFTEYSIPIRIAGTVQATGAPEIQWLYELLLLGENDFPAEDVFSVLSAPWSSLSRRMAGFPVKEIRKRLSDSGILLLQGAAWRSVIREYTDCVAVLEALVRDYHELVSSTDTTTWLNRFHGFLNSHGVPVLFEHETVIRWKRECEDFQTLASHIDEMEHPGSVLLDCARTRLLRSRMPVNSPPGEGVVVGGLQDLFGMEFERLYIVGLNRGVLPGSVTEDPFLSDATRSSLALDMGFSLPTRASRYQRDKLMFALMVYSATRSVHLSYSTIDESGKPLAPSILLSLLLGANYRVRTIPYRIVERMEKIAGQGGLMVPRNVFWLADEDGVNRGDAWERLASLFHGEYLSILRYGASRRTARYDPRRPGSCDIQLNGRYDPVINPLNTVQAWNDMDACPYRFFLRHVLGFEEPVIPKETWWLDELETGSLVHRFFRRVLAAEQMNDGSPPGELVHTAWLDVCAAYLENHPDDGLTPVRRYHLQRAGDWIEPLGIEEIKLVRNRRTAAEGVEVLREVALSGFSLEVTVGNGRTSVVPMSIRADRIDTKGRSRDTRESCIMDYKIRSDSSGWKRDAVSLQLYLYARAYTAMMKLPVRSEYIEIVRRGRPADVQTLRISPDDMTEELFERKLRILAGRWFGTERLFPFTRDVKICEYCAMRAYCRRFDTPLLEKSARFSGPYWTRHDEIDSELIGLLKARLETRYT